MIQLSTYAKALWIGNYGLKNILMDGRIEVYSGNRPATADHAATGTQLGRVTQNGAVFTPGSRSEGALKLLSTNQGVLTHTGNWRLTVTTAGIPTWFRFHGNYADDNQLDTAKVHIRMDGDVGPNGELYLDKPILTTGVFPVNFYLQFRNL